MSVPFYSVRYSITYNLRFSILIVYRHLSVGALCLLE
jgi:hypothetical protein